MASSSQDAVHSSSDIVRPQGQTLDVHHISDAETKARVEFYKSKGDDAYRKKEWYSAIECYTEAIQAGCKDNNLTAILLSNRATVLFQLEDYHAALCDAKAAKNIHPSCVKAIERGASACVKLNMFQEAVKWCIEGLATENGNNTLLELRDTSQRAKGAGTEERESGSDSVAEKEKLAGGEKIQRERRHCFRSLGYAYFKQGDFKTAHEYYNLDLGVAKEAGDRNREGWAYLCIGTGYDSLGDFKRAIEFLQLALSIGKEDKDKDLEGAAYSGLGNSCRSVGDMRRAIEFQMEAVNMFKVIGYKAKEAMALSNLGIVHDCQGNFKKAITIYYQALSIFEDVGDTASKGNVYGSLGNAFHSLGNFKKAIDFYQHALSIAKKVKDIHSEEMLYLNLGNTFSSLGDYKLAIEFHQQALGIAKKLGEKAEEGQAYGNLGNDYYSLRDFEKSIEFHQQALDIFKTIGHKNSEGNEYTNLGNVYTSLHDFETAVDFHKQALSIAKEVANKDLEGKVYNNLGSIYRSNGHFNIGIEFCQKALSIAKAIGDKASEGAAYCNLACAYNSDGDKDKAEHLFTCSVRLFDEVRELLLSKDEWKISLRNQYKDVYNALWMVQLEQSKPVEALFTAERGRAQALIDLMETQYGLKSAQPEPNNQIKSLISSYISSSTIFLAVAFGSINFWVLHKGQDCQFVQKRTNVALQPMIDEAYREIGVFQSVMCENRSLDEPTDDGSEMCRDDSLDGKGPILGKGNALKELYEVVIGPIAHLIQDNDAIISPDGPLLLVPFAALINQHSRYLSETLRIRQIPSLTNLKLMAECPERYHNKSGALIVGDPWVDNVRLRGKRVKQLPCARKEVEMIGAILKTEPLIGQKATKAEVLSRLNSVALVHIAAHGCAETGEIVLSPNPTRYKRPKEEDFLLTISDVLNAQLQAKLVVLSCCHSGRGKIKAEGVVGIARAFLGAGARSVLVSLWAIDDEATFEFMRNLYEHLIEGQSASMSLNQTMKYMRESDKFSAVRYWAPFVLIGDDVTLNFGQSSLVEKDFVT